MDSHFCCNNYPLWQQMLASTAVASIYDNNIYVAMSENVLGKIMKQACGPWGLIGLEEPPSQRKVHIL